MGLFFAFIIGFIMGGFIIFQRSKRLINNIQNDLNKFAPKVEELAQVGISGITRLEAVLTSMVEGVMVTNEKGEIVLMNPAMRKLFLVDSDPEGKMVLEVPIICNRQGVRLYRFFLVRRTDRVWQNRRNI